MRAPLRVSLLVIVPLALLLLFPLIAYTFGKWEAGWIGERRALYGPVTVADRAVLLTHPAGLDPATPAESVHWTLHLEHAEAITSAAVAYSFGDQIPDDDEWTTMTGVRAELLSAELAGKYGEGVLRVWLRLDTGKEVHRASWAIQLLR